MDAAGRGPVADKGSAAKRGVELLVVRGVSKQFGGTQALDDVGMRLESGEIVALLGENGAGKSTLIKILAGVYSSDKGEIAYRGVGRDGDAADAACRSPSSISHSDLEHLGSQLPRRGQRRSLRAARRRRARSHRR